MVQSGRGVALRKGWIRVGEGWCWERDGSKRERADVGKSERERGGGGEGIRVGRGKHWGRDGSEWDEGVTNIYFDINLNQSVYIA